MGLMPPQYEWCSVVESFDVLNASLRSAVQFSLFVERLYHHTFDIAPLFQIDILFAAPVPDDCFSYHVPKSS